VLTEAQAERLFSDAFRVWMQEQLADRPKDSSLPSALDLTAGPDSGDEAVRRAARAGISRSFATSRRRGDGSHSPASRLSMN
jgi:hypothetical protein